LWLHLDPACVVKKQVTGCQQARSRRMAFHGPFQLMGFLTLGFYPPICQILLCTFCDLLSFHSPQCNHSLLCNLGTWQLSGKALDVLRSPTTNCLRIRPLGAFVAGRYPKASRGNSKLITRRFRPTAGVTAAVRKLGPPMNPCANRTFKDGRYPSSPTVLSKQCANFLVPTRYVSGPDNARPLSSQSKPYHLFLVDE
jgi:hypothetical protein